MKMCKPVGTREPPRPSTKPFVSMSKQPASRWLRLVAQLDRRFFRLRFPCSFGLVAFCSNLCRVVADALQIRHDLFSAFFGDAVPDDFGGPEVMRLDGHHQFFPLGGQHDIEGAPV